MRKVSLSELKAAYQTASEKAEVFCKQERPIAKRACDLKPLEELAEHIWQRTMFLRRKWEVQEERTVSVRSGAKR